MGYGRMGDGVTKMTTSPFHIWMVKALCLIAAGFLAGGPVPAQEGGGGAGRGYESGAFWGTDLDRDEFISEEEAQAPTAKGLHRVFRQIDQNDDGLVGYYEFSHFLRNHPYYMKLAEKGKD